MKTDDVRWAKKDKNDIKKTNSRNWIHSPESLVNGHVAYLVKFLGNTDVERPKGIDVVQEAIRKLRFSQQIRKAEGQRTPKVELTVSVDGLAVQEPKGKRVQHQYPLHRITYCADDKAGKKFFCFIAQRSHSFVCYVFISNSSAEEITLTIGQAFDLAYSRYFEPRSPGGEVGHGDDNLLERQNDILRRRLVELSALIETRKLSAYLSSNGISSVLDLTSDNYSSLASSAFSSPAEEPTSPLPKEVNQKPIDLANGSAGRPSVGRLVYVESDDDFNPRGEESKSRRKASPSVLVIPQSKMAVFVQQKPANKEEPCTDLFGARPFAGQVDPFGMDDFSRLASPSVSSFA